MEALGRVELPTNGLGNRCSIHLSYRAMHRKGLCCVSLPQRGVAILLIPLPNCCPIAEWRLPSCPCHKAPLLFCKIAQISLGGCGKSRNCMRLAG